jgi:hypothetical protein
MKKIFRVTWILIFLFLYFAMMSLVIDHDVSENQLEWDGR